MPEKLTRKLDDKLVPEWRRPWRFWSARVLTVVIAFPDIYNVTAEALDSALIPSAAKWAIRLLVLAGYVARFWKQNRGTP